MRIRLFELRTYLAHNAVQGIENIARAWIEYLSKRDKATADTVNALIAKDQQRDLKDAEHDTLIQSIKSMAKTIEEPPPSYN